MYCMHFPPLRSSLRRYCDGSSHLCMLDMGHTCILQSKKAQPGYTHIEVLSDACTAALSPLYFCKLGKQELYEVVYKAGSMMKSKLAIRCHLTPLNCLALAFSFFFPRHCLGLDLILSDEMNTQPPEKPRVHCAFAFYSPHQLASSSKLHRYMCVYLLYPLVPPSSVLPYPAEFLSVFLHAFPMSERQGWAFFPSYHSRIVTYSARHHTRPTAAFHAAWREKRLRRDAYAFDRVCPSPAFVADVCLARAPIQHALCMNQSSICRFPDTSILSIHIHLISESVPAERTLLSIHPSYRTLF